PAKHGLAAQRQRKLAARARMHREGTADPVRETEHVRAVELPDDLERPAGTRDGQRDRLGDAGRECLERSLGGFEQQRVGLGASACDVLGELSANGVVECGGFVLVERTPEDLACARGRVVPAAALPALEVLRRGEERPVEAGAEALECVLAAEEVAALADL